MKKKVLSLIMALATLLSLAACGGKMKESMNDSMPPHDAYYGEYPSGGELIEGDPTADEYGALIENEFIKTEIENVSTFAADVDTASYAYFRKLVQSGYSLKELIATAGNSIRTEEMINYFDYGYDNPVGGELFSTKMQIAPCPWNENAMLMMLGLQAKKVETAAKNNLVFLIDVSGSMEAEDKLELLKKSFSHLVDKLGKDDVISIVTYAAGEEVVLEGCAGNKKDMIMKKINTLSAKGSTNGEAGLKKAYQIAEEYYIKDGNNRIILASDGDLNVGISSAEELEKFVSQKRNEGVFLSVLGFGTGNYKDAAMETIADCGNGVYYYIDGEDEAEKIFGHEIFSTLYTVAKDVKLQLTFNPDVIDAYRLVGYENRLLANEDFEDDTKDAGEMGAGHSLTVCYELILNTSEIPLPDDKDFVADNSFFVNALPADWMTLGVRYKEPDGEKSMEQNYAFGRGNYTETPDDNFKFVCAVVETSMILHKSKFIGDITLSDVFDTLNTLSFGGDFYKAQFKELIEMLVE